MSAPAGPVGLRERLLNDPRKLGTQGRGDPIPALVRAFEVAVAEILGRLGQGSDAADAFLLAQAEQIADALDRLDTRAGAWAREVLTEQYRVGAAVAQRELAVAFRRAGLPVLSGRFTGLDRRAARALIERTSANLGAVRQALVQGLALGDPNGRRTIEAIRSALASENRLVDLGRGRLAVRTPAGRMWDPTAYSRMVSRTAVADATRVSQRQRYLQNGTDVVRVVDTGSNHDVCQRWEGERLSLTGRTPGLPTVADARAAGLFHPNCTHRYVVDTSWLLQNGLVEPVRAPAEPPFSTLGERPQATRTTERTRLELFAARLRRFRGRGLTPRG